MGKNLNNPGNLRGLGRKGPWEGEVDLYHPRGKEPKKEGFVYFDSVVSGMRALGVNVISQQKKYGIATIKDLANRWAPAADRNDPVAYAANIAKELQKNVNDTIDFTDPAVLPVLMRLIMKREGTLPYFEPSDIEAGAKVAIEYHRNKK